jgi:type III protein arginine methyltransferase
MTDHTSLAEQAFEPLVEAAKGNARALLTLADKAYQRGDMVRGGELVAQAIALEPADREIAVIGADLSARSVPGFHRSMMMDGPRNNLFQRAIERAVTPEKHVLDIGSGSGLLAMMAARAGANQVHSCEMNPVIAAVAQKIVETNGYAKQVTIHAKKSSQLDPEKDLGGKADLIVAEIIGNDLVCENVLPTMRDVVRRLAKPDAQFIPRSGDIKVALAWSPDHATRGIRDVNGFKMSEFNPVLPQRWHYKTDDTSLKMRGEAASLYAFDFACADAVPAKAEVELVANGGSVNGVVQWFQLQLDEQISLENRPGANNRSSWSCEFYPFENEIKLAPGDNVPIAATIFGNRLRIWQP